MVRKFVSEVLAVTGADFAVAHGLGTSDVIVSARNVATNRTFRATYTAFSEHIIVLHCDEGASPGIVVTVIG